MKVAVLCERSGRVRDAFTKHGHTAVSNDIVPSDAPGPHITGDCLAVDWSEYDLVIAFPPCTHLARSGARWWKGKEKQQVAALKFVRALMDLPVEKIALENPIGKIGTAIRKADQIIQPWQFGHGETKSTCLWLKNLPLLKPTKVVSGRDPKVHFMPPGPDRARLRSLTYQGIADAMAQQWG